MEQSAQNPTIQLVELRNRLGDTINEVSYAGKRLTITRNGKPAAALICIEDLELLEALELKRDSEDFERALAEDDGYRITLEEFQTKHGLR